MWKTRPQKVAPSQITLRQSSTPHSFQELSSGRQLQSLVASPEPQFVTKDSDSNEPTFLYGFGNQNPIILLSLKDPNLPHNSFNVLATMAVIRPDEQYSPQSPERSIPSPVSTPPMNVSTIEAWETSHTTTDDNTFYSSESEPRRVYWDISLD